MKKTVNASIAGRNFILDEDAYNMLTESINNFRNSLIDRTNADKVMAELEGRIAELFSSRLGSAQVVDIDLTREVIRKLGMPQSWAYNPDVPGRTLGKPVHKIYRDKRTGKIGGVCAGLALYLDIDVTLSRLIFILLFFLVPGLFIYLVFWLVLPSAETPEEQCELRGIPTTPENLSRFQ